MHEPRADPASDRPVKIDLLTVGAIAIMAYLLSIVTHEALGHGLAALVFGGHIRHVSSVDLDYDASGLSAGAQRAIAAAGCAANIVIGLAVLGARRMSRHASANWRYFLWLLGHINLFIAGGYMMALSFVNFGDMHALVEGLTHRLLWQIILTITGAAISFATLWHAARSLDEFLGSTPALRRRRAAALTWTPYLVGSTVNTLAALLNPVGVVLVFTSALAASFGGTAFLAWSGAWVGRARSTSPDEPLTLTRDARWLAAGGAALALYFFVLGPGLPR